MDWAAAEPARNPLLLQIAGDLWLFWLVRGPWREGRAWLARALDGDASGASPGRAAALEAAGGLAIEQGDLEAAQPLLEESLAIWQQLEHREGVAHALNHLGALAHARFEYDHARALLKEALDIRRSIGDERGMAVSLRNLGLLAATQRDFQTARAKYIDAYMQTIDWGAVNGRLDRARTGEMANR